MMRTPAGKAAILTAALTVMTTATASHAKDFRIIAPNETALEVVDGLVTARLSDGGCMTGFENACSATRQQAEYQTSAGHGHGDRIAYRWEIKVTEDMKFNASDKHLYATRFVTGENKPVMQFYLGNDYGYEVNRKTCFGPEEFGKWHTVEVRVMWDATKKKGLKDTTPGEVHVICDDSEVFAKSGRPNIKSEDEVHLALGLEGALKLAEGDNVSVSFRNIEIGTW